MAELIAIGYQEEATAQQVRDEVSWLTKRPDTARAIIRNGEGTIWVATNPFRLAVGIIWGMVLGLLVDLAAGTDAVVEALSRYGGTMLESSLSLDAEWRLPEALLGRSTS